ncbi:MAG TPA: FAD-binding oxidoreductase [Candidatus Limnocylindrales bacterium]
MRSWNGWGDEGDTTSLGGGGRRMLESSVGLGTPPREATLAEVVGAVPPSRLDAADHLRITTDPETRVRRARGQSLPDLAALRYGRLEAVPDAVARPAEPADVRALIDHAKSVGARLIPYGGGTSVVGGVTARPCADPLITVDLGALVGVRDVDEQSGLVSVLAGTTGPALAILLAGHGLVVGHEPQSWELATVGGWVAARGSGLKSLGVGRIEQLFAGGTLEAPAGTLVMPPHPASAAGPDLRQLVLGSEGRLGILTEATLRATPHPEVERMEAWALPAWPDAVDAVRQLVQARPGLSLLRLSTPSETRTLLAFADKPAQTRLLSAYVRARRLPSGWVLVLTGVAGRKRTARAASGEARAILGGHGGVRLPALAAAWSRTRFRSPYLRNALWSAGYASDTLETATDWAHVPGLVARIEAALAGALAPWGEKAHVFTHLSHLYPSGSSLYVTYIFRLAPDPDETIARWTALKSAASHTIRADCATISHHHGVGVDHAPYLADEKGPLGMAALRAVVRTFDPDGMMNPGVLLPEPE